MITFFLLWGVVSFLYWTWEIQVHFGNWLKHNYPNSKLRILWWSLCDIEGGCDVCYDWLNPKYRK